MQDQLSLLLTCRGKFCVCCSNLMYSCTWSSRNFLNRKYCCNICTKNLICGWCFFSYSMLYQKMYVKDNFFMSRNFCFSFVLEYDNVLYANEVETKEKQKLLNIKNELCNICTWVEHTGKYEACKALAYFAVWSIWTFDWLELGRAKKWFQGRGWCVKIGKGPPFLLACPFSMYLWVPL